MNLPRADENRRNRHKAPALRQPEADHQADIAPNPSERQKSEGSCGCPAVWRYRYRSAAGGAVAKVAPILDVGGGRSWRAPKWPRLCEDPRVEAVGSTYRLAVACDLVGRPDLLELEGAAVEKRRQIAAIRDIADLDGGAAITVFDLGQDGHWSIQLVATSGNKGSLQLTGIVQELVAILETQALLFARSGKKFVPSKID